VAGAVVRFLEAVCLLSGLEPEHRLPVHLQPPSHGRDVVGYAPDAAGGRVEAASGTDWVALADDGDGHGDDCGDGAVVGVLAAESLAGVEALRGTGWCGGKGWRVWGAALVGTGWAGLSRYEARGEAANRWLAVPAARDAGSVLCFRESMATMS
jgi:hypothetical protein